MLGLLVPLALADPGGPPAEPAEPPTAVVRGTVLSSRGQGDAFTPAFLAWLRVHRPKEAAVADGGQVFRPWDHQLVTVDVREVLADRTGRALAVGQQVVVYVPDPYTGAPSSDALLYLAPYVGAWGETVPPFTEPEVSYVLAKGATHPFRQEAAWVEAVGCRSGCTWAEMLEDARQRLTVE